MLCATQGGKAEAQPIMLQISLVKELYFGPLETRVVRVKLSRVPENTKDVVGVLCPTNKLAEHRRDFVEELWIGGEDIKIPITNWNTTPIVVPINEAIGEIEEVTVVGHDDPV